MRCARTWRALGLVLFKRSAPMTVKTLNDIPNGQVARIRRLFSSRAVRQRLLDLGLMPDVTVGVVRSAPLNDPIELRLDASSICLRRQEAATVEVYQDEP